MKCRSCGEKLYPLIYITGVLGVGTKSFTKQCLNPMCKKYGRAV